MEGVIRSKEDHARELHTMDENRTVDIRCGNVGGVRRKIMPIGIFVIDAGRRDQVIRTGRRKDIATHINEQVRIEQEYTGMEE